MRHCFSTAVRVATAPMARRHARTAAHRFISRHQNTTPRPSWWGCCADVGSQKSKTAETRSVRPAYRVRKISWLPHAAIAMAAAGLSRSKNSHPPARFRKMATSFRLRRSIRATHAIAGTPRRADFRRSAMARTDLSSSGEVRPSGTRASGQSDLPAPRAARGTGAARALGRRALESSALVETSR